MQFGFTCSASFVAIRLSGENMSTLSNADSKYSFPQLTPTYRRSGKQPSELLQDFLALRARRYSLRFSLQRSSQGFSFLTFPASPK